MFGEDRFIAEFLLSRLLPSTPFHAMSQHRFQVLLPLHAFPVASLLRRCCFFRGCSNSGGSSGCGGCSGGGGALFFSCVSLATLTMLKVEAVRGRSVDRTERARTDLRSPAAVRRGAVLVTAAATLR